MEFLLCCWSRMKSRLLLAFILQRKSRCTHRLQTSLGVFTPGLSCRVLYSGGKPKGSHTRLKNPKRPRHPLEGMKTKVHCKDIGITIPQGRRQMCFVPCSRCQDFLLPVSGKILKSYLCQVCCQKRNWQN